MNLQSQPLSDLLSGANDNIDADLWVDPSYDPSRLLERAALIRHHYQQVQVRKRSRVSVGMRAKDDDFFGIELARNRVAYLVDLLGCSHVPRVSHRTSGAARALGAGESHLVRSDWTLPENLSSTTPTDLSRRLSPDLLNAAPYRVLNNGPVSFEAFPFGFGVDCLTEMSSRNARAACD